MRYNTETMQTFFHSGNVIEKKSPNAFDKNVQGEGKTVFWTDFAPKQLKRGIFGMCAKFYVISMYI